MTAYKLSTGKSQQQKDDMKRRQHFRKEVDLTATGSGNHQPWCLSVPVPLKLLHWQIAGKEGHLWSVWKKEGRVG